MTAGEKRVRLLGRLMEEGAKPKSFNDLVQLLHDHGEVVTVDAIRKSLATVTLDGQPVYVKSTGQGRADEEAERETIKRIKVYYNRL